MRSARFLLISATVYVSFSAASGLAQAVAPSIQIVDSINESRLVSLKGNTYPLANANNDRGRVSPDLPMTDLILVLSRSPQQQAAFEKFVASQYDPHSPNFHQWLKPDEVGADFGPSPADIATISNWLSGHGFSVNEVTRDRMSIRFSGTAARVESAFHTEIHNLEVRGVQHIGNMSDPQIPAALAPAVAGIKSLHNFFAHPMHRTGSRVTRDAATGKWLRNTDTAQSPPARRAAPLPQFGISVPADPTAGTSAYLEEDVAPYDFATIYNVLPLWTATTPIDGTGQTVAIAGTSDICLGQTDANCSNTAGGYNNDVATFRAAFGLPAYTSANQPTVISGNGQPLTVCPDAAGLCSSDDLIENSLDVEWSGSVAKGANIVLVASYPSSGSDDTLYDSESYIVNNQTASIMSVSYGLCELFNGTAGNVQYYDLWQTASTEGIAVFVASGDAAAADCDDGGDANGVPYSAQYGLSVNGLASTPYNTAVGGTDFNWCSLTSTTECPAAPYWNASNASNGSSAKGYVPEVPWNDTCASSLALGYLEQQATALSVTGVTDAESACNFAYNKSSSGNGDLAYFVDTVGGGGGASNCVASSSTSSTIGTCTTGATSTGATQNPDTGAAQASLPVFADGWPKPSWQAGVTGIPPDGVRDLPDLSFFASDGFLSYSAYLICVSLEGDCTYSTTTEPIAQEVGGTSVSSPAMAGVMALINQKAGEAQGSPNTELYQLASKQTYSNCSAEKATTGNVCLFNDIDSSTIAVPCDYGAQEGNPAQAGIQSPDCTVIHGGDLVGILPGYGASAGYDQATGLGSLNVANVVNAWPSAATSGNATVTVTPAQASLSAGSALSVTVKVASSSSGATPTGKVTLLGGGYSSGAQPLSAGAYTFNIPANTLSAGSDVFTVSYSGDTTYAAATGTATVTVAAVVGTGTATVTVIPSQASLSASTALSVAVAVAASPSSGATPTGTVTLTGGGYTSTAETLASGDYTFSIPANSLSVGTDVLTVSYSGDTTYAAVTGTATVTVTASTSAGTFALSATTPSAVAPGTTATSTITVSTTNSYTGTASLTCVLTSSPSGAVDAPTCSLSPTTVALSSTSTSGTVTASVATTAATSSQLIRPEPPGKGGEWMGGGAVLALLVFFGIPARRRSWRSMLGAFLLMGALAGLSGCGDFWQAPTGNAADGTTTGNYTFTVTGTGAPAVSGTVTTTFIVTVN